MRFLHHALVRLRALRCGVEDFRDYLVLGDDIVIAREEVRKEYTRIMSQIGVEISLRKRVPKRISTGCEFASKLICDMGDLSPLPAGCVLAGTVSSLFQLWDALLVRGRALGANPEVTHGADFRDSFPLADKASGHEELRTL
jgi:hypothetical protein